MQDVMQAFVEEERAKNHSDETIRKRKMVMEWLDEWADKSVEEFERSDIRRYLTHLKGQAADGTVLTYMAQVTKLFEYLAAERHIDPDENPCEKLNYNDYLDTKTTETRKALREKKSYIALKSEEAEKLLANPKDPKLRNTLMMKLQLETGARGGELVRLRMDDVDMENQTVTYQTLKKDSMEFRELGFSDGVRVLMEEWMNSQRDRLLPAADSPYVFVTLRTDHITRARYNKIVKESARNAGIQEQTRVNRQGNKEWKVRSHVLRHTYAEQMVENGCDISRLADLMGHEDINTTRKYLDHDEEALKKAQKQFSPKFGAEGD